MAFTDDIVSLKAEAESYMFDRCEVWRRPEPSGTEPIGGSYVRVTADIPCRIAYQTRTSEAGGAPQITITGAILRLPHGTDCRATDRIRLVNRLGETLPATHDYEVIGAPDIGVTTLSVNIARVEGGSVR